MKTNTSRSTLETSLFIKVWAKHAYAKNLICLFCLFIPFLLQAQDRNIAINETYPNPMFKHYGGRIINVKRLVEAGIYSSNAIGDGVADDSDEIIAAMDWVVQRLRDAGNPCGWSESWYIYFPNGTYLVSKSLHYTGDALNDCTGRFLDETDRDGVAGLKLVGQNREGVTIRLKDNTPDFAAGARKPVVSFSRYDLNSMVNTSPAGFHFRNITIHTGSGNPGAIGLDYLGANGSRLDNVKITGSGEIGLHIRSGTAHGYYSNLTVDGFKYGIYLSGKTTESHPSIEYVTLSGQSISAIYLEKISVSLRKVHSTNSVNGITIQKIGVYSPHMVLLDSDFHGGGSSSTAIQINQGFLFARNVSLQGYGTAIKKATTVVQQSGSIEEYISEAITTFSPTRVRSTAIKSMNLPIEDYPLMPWVSSGADWANVDEYGAVGDGVADDTQAIQSAMNSGKPFILFPKQKYNISGTVSIPASTKQLIAAEAQILGTGIKFDVNASSPDVLAFRFMNLEGGSINHSTQRTILLESTSSKDIYKSNLTTPGGKLFANNVHGLAKYAGNIKNISVWARFLNHEKAADFQFTAGVGSTFWVMGFKIEKTYSIINVTDGAKMEILGGEMSRWGAGPTKDDGTGTMIPDPRAGIVNNNSHISIVAATHGPNRLWDPMIRDIQGATTKEWTMSQFPDRGYNANIVIPLYASYNPAVIPQPTSPSLSVTSFTLMNADTDQPIAGFNPIAEGAVIDYTKIGTTHINIRANTSTATASVKFGYDTNPSYRIETEAPYSIAADGNSGADYYSWTPALGAHSIIATPYSAEGATGSVGPTKTLNFTIANTDKNLALKRPVTASSQETANPASNAVDGDVVARWSALTAGYPHSITVDLGEVYALSKTQLVPYADRAYKYKVEVATTVNGTYTQVVNRTTNTTGGSLLIDNFTANARYVKLTVVGASNYTGGWVSINEFRVYGKEIVTVNARLAYEPQGGERQERGCVVSQPGPE